MKSQFSELKVCSKCGIPKPPSCFHKSYGVPRPYCSECGNAQSAAYKIKNRDKIKAYEKKYREGNKDILIKRNALYRSENRDKVNEIARNSYKKHRDKYLQRSRVYQSANIDKVRAYERVYRREKRKNDILAALKVRLSNRCRDAFAYVGKKKNTKTEKLLGISVAGFKLYIEAKFKPGMSWENRSEWHIDHVIPLASARTEEDVFNLCHYLNLQPLWSTENIQKGCKIINV